MHGLNFLAAPAFAACAAASAPAAAAAEWPEPVRSFSSPQQAIEVSALFPNSAGMQRRRLAAAIALSDADEALTALRRLAGMGAVPSQAELVQASSLVGHDAIAQLAACFAANGEPLGRSRVYATVSAEQRLVDGLLWDPERRRLFATSVVDGRLASVGGAAASSEPLGSLLGGAYDPSSRRFWIASAAMGMAPAGRPEFAGLVSVDPSDLSDVTRIPAPAGAAPADVAIAADGTVYASDGLNGAVYRCAPGCSALETWLAPGTLYSAQGLALSADQRLLYIADRRYGLAAAERATGRLFRVDAAPGVMLDGIDGPCSPAGRSDRHPDRLSAAAHRPTAPVGRRSSCRPSRCPGAGASRMGGGDPGGNRRQPAHLRRRRAMGALGAGRSPRRRAGAGADADPEPGAGLSRSLTLD